MASVDDSMLLKISILVMLAGISALFIISERTEIPETSIKEIKESGQTGTSLKITGEITRYSDTEKVAFLEIAHQDTITVVVFKDKDFAISPGTKVEITGTTDEFRGQIQVIANEIRTIS